ncbi:MAG: transcriptional regulator MraZ [Chloroflexi bacterium]|nr:MAG: transcriptional regulator MraZ [Chloroflexota bacterium]
MFLGQYSHTVDDKGRLTIPSRFRADLEGGVVITRGLDGCLWAYPRSEWDRQVEAINALPTTTNAAARNFVRFFFSNASDSVPDRQGRVLIPQNLRDYAAITSETVVVGVNNRVEIWNPERWAEVFNKVEADPDAMMSQLQDMGISL